MEFECRLKVILAEEKIKDQRFTQRKFAEKIGVTNSTLSLIVNGKNLPSFEVVYRICKELKRPLEEIWVEK
ncbi:helix-turn-helix transcriptional regulator [Neobacillus sp. NPDC093127]|uniref:helix-turn-helix transcriptional regulator n=1 Tax=Neobacillus sp. NPDC093127 TaxID=3364296 RepID=UPI00380CF467